MKPKEQALFHYTRSFDTLLQIIDGASFWPHFCAEDFSWMTQSPRYLVVPMVSFCDMPLGSSHDHRKTYGRYVIGLSKEWGRRSGVNPVFYIAEDSLVAASLRRHHRAIESLTLTAARFEGIWPVLPYLKPVTGAFPDAAFGRHSTGIKDFDEEMEWRFVPAPHIGNMFSTALYDATASERANSLNEETQSTRLRFHLDDVEIVVVSTVRQQRIVARRFPAVRTKIRTWDDF